MTVEVSIKDLDLHITKSPKDGFCFVNGEVLTKTEVLELASSLSAWASELTDCALSMGGEK